MIDKTKYLDCPYPQVLRSFPQESPLDVGSELLADQEYEVGYVVAYLLSSSL